MISPRVKHFIAEGTGLSEWIPGQFITIHFEKEGQPFRRSYSLANASGNNEIEFAAGYVENGPGSDFLFHLKPGDSFNITGPFGKLVLKDEIPKRYILVSTSTGITPYRAMIPELRRRLETNSELSLVILHGVQHREDLLYASEFQELQNAFPHQIRYIPSLSRIDNPSSCEHKGYVQQVFTQLKLQPNDDHVYLCGNPAMIDESFTILKSQGFAISRIIREKYIS